MKNKICHISLIALIALFCWACEENVLQPLSQGEKPGPITSYSVESLPGGAKINYDLPLSKDLLYVKAEYKLDGGSVREAKSSIYKNHLIVDGFGKAGEYNALIYAVSKGEVQSDPTEVNFTTLTPPYLNAFNSLSMTAVFGGLNISFENENSGDLAFVVLVIDSTNKWSPLHTYYTNSKKGDFSVRGLDTIQYTFGAFVRDRWGNLSDTLTGNYKPLYESLINNSTFSALKQLPGDVWKAHTGAPTLVIERAWDGNIATEFHTSPNSGMPQSFSIDMGKKVKLSRFKYHQRASTRWNAGNPKYFELWGSNEPNTDGSWESWTKIGEYESIKPSGQALGTNSAEDIAKAIEGEDFDIPIFTPAFRYYRWKTVRTWANMTYISIGELTFWGSVLTE
jgi:hypothetical protein